MSNGKGRAGLVTLVFTMHLSIFDKRQKGCQTIDLCGNVKLLIAQGSRHLYNNN